jgi:DNA-directed RNA polymerase
MATVEDPEAIRAISGIAPNFIHSLDASHLRLTINAARSREVESFAMVHDCYGTTAADAPKVATLLRWAFMEMYEQHAPLSELRARLMDAVGSDTRRATATRSAEH